MIPYLILNPIKEYVAYVATLSYLASSGGLNFKHSYIGHIMITYILLVNKLF